MSKETVRDRQSRLADEISYFFENFPNDEKFTKVRYFDANGFSPSFCSPDDVNLIGEIRKKLENARQILSYQIQISTQGLESLEEVVKTTIANIYDISTYIDDLNNQFPKGFDAGRVHEPILKDKKTSLYNKLNTNLDAFEVSLSKLEVPYLKNSIRTLENEVSQIKNRLGDVGLSKFSSQYRGAAKGHSLAAGFWLLFGILLAAIVTIISFAVIKTYQPSLGGFDFVTTFFVCDTEVEINTKPKSNMKILPIQELSSVLFLTFLFISIPMYMMVVCFKNYKINKHNQLLNRHRELALETFSTFIASAGSDGEMRKLVFDRATTTIYENPDFGYLNTDNDYKTPAFFPVQHLKSAVDK